MEILRDRIVHLRRHGVAIPDGLTREWQSLAETLAPEQCQIETITQKVDAKVSAEIHEEAAELLTTELSRFPAHVELQSYYLDFKLNIAHKAELQGLLDPASFQFRKLYELASELGEVTLLSHALMVEHWLSQNEIENARVLSRALRTVAPGLKVTFVEKESA